MIRNLDRLYWRQVNECLCCSHQNRIKFRQQTIKDVQFFLKENPECTMEVLTNGLGEPEEYANICMEEVNRAEKQQIRKSWKKYGIAAASLVCILFLSLAYMWITRPTRLCTVETVIYEEEPAPEDFYNLPGGTAMEDGGVYEVPIENIT